MSNDTMTKTNMSLMRGCNGCMRCTRGALAAANLVVRLLVAEEPSEDRAAYDALPARLHDSEPPRHVMANLREKREHYSFQETNHITW